ncbi:MAG: MltA domain-containing protein [Proteobacteria bacterium]|nr:MltA domain-containing protein [Pseudomonadota bacterium]
MNSPFHLAAVLLFLVVTGCAQDRAVVTPPDTAAASTTVRFKPLAFSALPQWAAGRQGEALAALSRSCGKLLRGSPARWMTDKSVGGRVGDWTLACRAGPSSKAGHDEARRYFETWFQPYEVSASPSAANPSENGLFTGYFEPNLRGSLTQSDKFNVPLYQRPDDLVLVKLGDWRDNLRGERIAGRIIDGRLKPYHSRADIEAGAIKAKAQPLAWVDDPVDAFFLHIQGSGRIVLPDGGVVRAGYDGHNGHVYQAIGRYLIEAGEITREAMSLQSIRAWLKANPTKMITMMNRNPSYIFFRRINGAGPIGAQGVPLTPGRSLAVDPSILPLGAPIWVSIDYPDEAGRPLRRMMVAQDTGGAIKGAVRGDVFWGHGDAAGALAGPMKAPGRLYLLLPKTLRVAHRR